MKKIMCLLVIMMSYFYASCEKFKDAFPLQLEALAENEKFQIVKKKYSEYYDLEITNGMNTKLYYLFNGYWGEWQISKDKRKVLLYTNGMHKIYYIDGNTGIMKYLGEVRKRTWTDFDFKYILTHRYDEELEMEVLSIMDLETLSELYYIPWLSQEREKYEIADFSVERSLDENYDFIVYMERGEFADEITGYAYLNVEKRIFEEHNVPLNEKFSSTREQWGYE